MWRHCTESVPITETVLVVRESATHLKPTHVGELYEKIEVTKPAHWFQYIHSDAYLMQ